MLKTLQKTLIITLLIVGSLYLLYEGFLYYRAQDKMPPGMTIGGVNVAGLTIDQTAERLTEVYASPILLNHREETVELIPADVGFMIDLDSMLSEAEAHRAPEEWWQGYLEFVIGRALTPVEIELRATHDRDLLLERLDMLASFMDKPATGPRLIPESETFVLGQDGYVTDVAGSLPDVEAALYRPTERSVELVVEDQEALAFDINILRESVEQQLQSFDGVGSVFIMDLQTGEELGINADHAISGLSILKIPIFVAAYRALDEEPSAEVQEMFYDTAVRSSNYGANLLLHIIAGEANTYRGADLLTETMHELGLINTFMVVPYDAPTVPTRPDTMVTPANSRADSPFVADPSRQTTAEEIGTLLAEIYHCAQGGGALLAVFPGEITPDECQAIIDLMVLNEEGNLIRFGVPDSVRVSHKHGWDGTTYGDAGIVFSPGGDYVLVEYVHLPNQWLEADVSFPILREISREVYNYFNLDAPYFGDPLEEERAFEEGGSATGAEVGPPSTREPTDEAPAEAGDATAVPSPTPPSDGATPPAEGTATPTPTPEPPGIEARAPRKTWQIS